MRFRFTRSIVPAVGKMNDATEFAAEITDYLGEKAGVSLS